MNSNWQDIHCKAVDDEHIKLHGMLMSLKSVFVAGASRVIVTEAIAVVRQRLDLHFQQEERLAAAHDPQSSAILAEDHQNLRQHLATLVGFIQADDAVRAKVMADFLEALARHDREVDMPIFRPMGGKPVF